MKPVVVTSQYQDGMVQIRANENVGGVNTKRGDESDQSMSIYNGQKLANNPIVNIEKAALTMNPSNLPAANEGIDHYKKLFSFSKFYKAI